MMEDLKEEKTNEAVCRQHMTGQTASAQGAQGQEMQAQAVFVQGVQEQNVQEQEAPAENPMIKKRWFGRGIYGSKDVPIRLLDGFIGAVIVVIVAMIVFFTVTGGFWVRFDTGGGSQVEAQKLRHGSFVTQPDNPTRPGYDFAGWSISTDEQAMWNFDVDKIAGDLTLYAVWTPASMTVRFDTAGGTVAGAADIQPIQVVFGETYGELPAPQKEGARFDGWYYSGEKITADTTVTMTGEHVLTAVWE